MARDRKQPTYHTRIRTVLADGKTHTLREIYRAVARFIPADAAEREYRKRHPNADDVKVADRIAQGRKRLVFLSLNSLIHHRGLVIARGKDWERSYRLTRAALAVLTPAPKTEGGAS